MAVGRVTPEERAEIRARAEAGFENGVDSVRDLGWYYVKDVQVLLTALDVCEAERDAAVEILGHYRADMRQRNDWRALAFLASVATEESNE